MLFYHGTTSGCLDKIKKDGFSVNSYFTTSYADAEYYAAIGGEWDLEKREKEYKKKHGIAPRDVFYPDLWDMCEEHRPLGRCSSLSLS